MANRRKTSKKLTRSQRFNLIAKVYLTGEGRPFESEAERRAAWEAHRDELMAASRPGLRPGSFWNYDRPDLEARRIPHETDVQLLYRLGLLSPDEIAQLTEWGRYPPEEASGRDPREMLGRTF